MLIIISPAKKLDWNSPESQLELTERTYSKESQRLIKELKKLSVADISQLMKLSDKLSELNFGRYRDYGKDQLLQRPALWAFAGDTYVGLQAGSLKKNEVKRAQNQLRILSGLYGALKPLDRIYPYRLEMGTSLKVGSKKNLYQF